MTRKIRIGLGVALVVVGVFATIGGVALLAFVGPDGRFEVPSTRARSAGYALMFDAIYLRDELPADGSLSATLRMSVTGEGDPDVFVGVGPSPLVADYLRGVAVDRVVQVDWPGGVRTEPIGGQREPGPPGRQTFWVASSEGPSAAVDWTLAAGDWTVVVMNADASRTVDVTGSVTFAVPILGPISIGVFVTGLVMLGGGVLLTVKGARTPRSSSPLAAAGPPPRPDAGR